MGDEPNALVARGETALEQPGLIRRAGRWLYAGPKWIARKVGRAWLAAEGASTLHVAIAAWTLDRNNLWPTALWPAIALAVQVFVTTVSKAQVDIEKEAKEQAERAKEAAQRELRDLLIRHKRYVSGNMSYALRSLLEGDHAQCAHLQEGLLRHGVDVAKDYLGLSRADDRLAATWCVPVENFTMWEVVRYDRSLVDRQSRRRRRIADGIPGAATAFLTGEVQWIPDTLDPRHSAHFPQSPPYRSILSIPARVQNVRCEANVTISDCPCVIVGVLNLDCSALGVVTEDVAYVLQDLAYIIAVLEYLGGQNAPTAQSATKG